MSHSPKASTVFSDKDRTSLARTHSRNAVHTQCISCDCSPLFAALLQCTLAWLCMALKPVLTLLVLLQVLAIDEPLPAAHLRKHSQHRVTKKVTIVRHRQARTSTIFLSHPRRLSPLSAQCKWYLPWCLGQWACLGHIMHTSSSSLKHT